MRTPLFLIILLSAFTFFAINVRRLISYLKVGKSADRFDHPWLRLKNVLSIAFAQKKLLREPLAGWMHFMIFWGFIVLLTAILETFLEGLNQAWSFAFLGPLYAPLIFLQDLFGVLVVLSILVALYRRHVAHVKRLQVSGHSQFDATLILILIFSIMVSMFLQNATHIAYLAATGNAADAGVLKPRFFSTLLATLFSSSSPSTLHTLFEVFWWAHVLLVLSFLNYLPYSKHLHIGSSFFNVYFSSLKPRGELPPVNLEAEDITRFGAADITDLTWKQLLDGYTCTECGRCDSVCPANLTGKPLSPRKIITDIRHRTMEYAPELLSAEKHEIGKQLVDGYITEEELWSCTTCSACMEECPVTIEHVPTIIEMRRYLVLNESRFPSELAAAYRNLENNFTVWAFNWRDRAKWAEGLNVPIASEISDNFEILYWVGCAGSFDMRYQKVARAFSELMNIAGVKFAILGNEEKCTGDPARRSGNEYLAQTLIRENIEVMNKHKVKKIVATCPHCFNTLKNEYPDFGGNYEVVHHTDFIMDLINSGRLKLSPSAMRRITYHDSCYIGRYNGIYDAPREALKSIQGVELVEMNRTRDKGLCCGAGGARMWMEEKIGKRINIERTEEAISVSPDVVASACPFCLTMLTDGLKSKDREDVEVKDIAELVLESIKGSTIPEGVS
ncbi:MAG: (Fe-S)-binding protein [Candidatus Kryptoniota bacterium]